MGVGLLQPDVAGNADCCQGFTSADGDGRELQLRLQANPVQRIAQLLPPWRGARIKGLTGVSCLRLPIAPPFTETVLQHNPTAGASALRRRSRHLPWSSLRPLMSPGSVPPCRKLVQGWGVRGPKGARGGGGKGLTCWKACTPTLKRVTPSSRYWRRLAVVKVPGSTWAEQGQEHCGKEGQ